MTDSLSMDPKTEMLRREAKHEMCFQLTNCIYMIGGWEVGLGDKEKRALLTNFLLKSLRYGFEVVFVKIILFERIAERQERKRGRKGEGERKRGEREGKREN